MDKSKSDLITDDFRSKRWDSLKKEMESMIARGHAIEIVRD